MIALVNVTDMTEPIDDDGTKPLPEPMLTQILSPYGTIDQGQHYIRQWLFACCRQGIIWTNADLLQIKS